jgi:hypothetical protein
MTAIINATAAAILARIQAVDPTLTRDIPVGARQIAVILRGAGLPGGYDTVVGWMRGRLLPAARGIGGTYVITFGEFCDWLAARYTPVHTSAPTHATAHVASDDPIAALSAVAALEAAAKEPPPVAVVPKATKRLTPRVVPMGFVFARADDVPTDIADHVLVLVERSDPPPLDNPETVTDEIREATSRWWRDVANEWDHLQADDDRGSLRSIIDDVPIDDEPISEPTPSEPIQTLNGEAQTTAQQIIQVATRYYFMFDVSKMLDVPQRRQLYDAAKNEFEALGQLLLSLGATLEARPRMNFIDFDGPLVVMPNGYPVGAIHKHAEVLIHVDRMIAADRLLR